MRPTTLILFGLSGLSLAYQSAIMERQLQTIVDVLNNVATATEALDSAIKGYNGRDPAPLLTASQKVLDTTTQGTSQINGTSPISLTEATQVQKSVQSLTTTLQSTISDLISKKPMLVAAGGGATIETSLKQQLSAAKELAAAIVSKVPEGVQQIAWQAASGITNNIQRGVKAFHGTLRPSGAAAAAPSSAISITLTAETAPTRTGTADMTTGTATLAESVATGSDQSAALAPSVSAGISAPAGAAPVASIVSILASGLAANATATSGLSSQFTGAAASYGPRRAAGAFAVGLAIFAF